MPLEVQRLRKSRSWLLARRKPEIGFYMINLWSAAWHNVPAGSLEDDDDVLADQAMCDSKRWPKVRDEALRGWVRASDGRLYHNVLTEKVLEAWEAKRAQRARTAAATEARKAKKQRNEERNVPRDVGRNDQRNDERNGKRDDNATFTKGQGQGQREGKGEKKESSNSASFSQTSAPETPLDRLMVAMKLDHKALHRRPSFREFPALFQEWKAQGCDPERDIWPTIERIAARKTDIGSPKFFEAAVLRARDDRTAAEPTEAERWAERVAAYRTEKFWSPTWGPTPDEPGCLAPTDLVAQGRAA